MRGCYGVLIGLGLLSSMAWGENARFEMPALAPPAEEPVDLKTLSFPSESQDEEEILRFFADHQARLSDSDRIEVLMPVLRPQDIFDGSGIPHNQLQNSLIRPILNLALKDSRQRYVDAEGQQWRVSRAQLVCFLDRKKPIAYVKDLGAIEITMRSLDSVATKPNERMSLTMAALREGADQMPFRTRVLTESETVMLQKTLKNLKPASDVSQKEMTMVAPILARKSCLRCHEVNLKAPLGAFSYVLARD